MGFWPFGGGKRQRAAGSGDHGQETLIRRAPSDTVAQSEKHGVHVARSSRNNSKSRQEENQIRRLSKTRTPSSKALPHAQPSRSQTAPVRAVDNNRETSRTDSRYDEKGLYQQIPLSQSSIGPENFTVVQSPPTLHAKRGEFDSHMTRRQSSKRKADDFAREREIRAMSSSPIPIPKRPATLYGTGPLERDSRQIPGPLNRRLERPTSEVSLPLPGSLPDIMDFPNQNSFKIGLLAALSPRPTVRYDANPKNLTGKLPARSGMAIRQAIEEEDTSDKKRIDELADDLDAGGLRELMERDRRRRDRKREAEKAKLQRRLQRRAERQREEEARRARTEAFVRSSPIVSSGPVASSVESSPMDRKDSPYSRRQVDTYENDPFSDPDPLAKATGGPIRNPFEDEKDMDNLSNPPDSDNEVGASEAIPVPMRSPRRTPYVQETESKPQTSQSNLSPPVSPVNRAVDRSSLSQASLLNREMTPDIPENASLKRRASDQSSQRMSSWTTFFRRGTRRKFTGPSQGRATPSEFSNTSRESISRKQPPVVAPRTFRRSDSATPQRTMSRFREDLPELPISPPDSRVQSPEATGGPSSNVVTSDMERETTSSQFNMSSARDSSGLQIGEQLDSRQPKHSVDLDVPMSSSGAGMILSQSLASVDSEGSWLSGKPSKRQSGQMIHGMRPSQSSLKRHVPGAFEEDDDYILDSSHNSRPKSTSQTRLRQDQRPGPENNARSVTNFQDQEQRYVESKSVELPSPSDTGDEKRLQGVARHPMVVQPPGRAKSQEGLLEKFATPEEKDSSSDEAEGIQDSDASYADAKETPLLRARSVDHRGHIRQVGGNQAKPQESSSESPAVAERKDSSFDEAEDTQDSESPNADANETPLLRARSVDYKSHVRHISAGSAKLLDIQRSSIHSDIGRAMSAVRKSDLSLNVGTPSQSQSDNL